MITAANKYRPSRHQKAVVKTVVFIPEHSFQKQPFAVVLQKRFFSSKNGVEEKRCWSFFSIKLQAWRTAILLKGDSNTGIFL